MQTPASITNLRPSPLVVGSPPSHRPAPSPPRAATAQQIAEYMHLVQRLASRFMRRLPRSVQRDDLVAAGALGLLHALRSTSHTSAAMFTAYASVRIHGAMLDELRRQDWSPRRRKVAVATGGPAPSNVVSIAPRGDASIPPVRPCVAVVGLDDLPLGVLAGLAEGGLSPLEDILERSERAALHAAVQQLPDREREIVSLRYFQGMPSKAVAALLGLSEARISQLHARATARLKDILADSAEDVKLAA